MPQIRPYESPIEGLQPSDRGAEGAAMAGRRVGAFYHQAGEEVGGAVKAAGDTVDRFVGHQEVSHLGPAFAGKMNELEDGWNHLIASGVDPNDPTVAKKFLSEQVEPELQKLENAPLSDTGQQFAKAHAEAIRQHFYNKTAADMSSLAGEANVRNVEMTGNTYSGISFKDPSSTKQSLDLYQKSVDALTQTGNMDAAGIAKVNEHAFHVKEQIALSGLQGLINKNPDADYSKFASDPAIAPYLKGSDPKAVQQYQQGQQRIQKSYETQDRQEKDRQNTEEANGIATKAYTQFTKVDSATGKIIVTDPAGYANATRTLALHPGAKQGQLDTMVKFGEHLNESGGKETTDPFVKRGLQDAILDNAASAEDIARAHTEGKLSGQDYHDTMGMFNDLKKEPTAATDVKTVLEAAKTTIMATIPGLPGKDPVGDKNYSDFVNKLVPAIAHLSPQERSKALNFKDPNSLINQMMAPYVRSPQQMMKDRIDDYGKLGASISTPTPAPAAKPIVDKVGYDSLAHGAKYTAPDGTVRTKP